MKLISTLLFFFLPLFIAHYVFVKTPKSIFVYFSYCYLHFCISIKIIIVLIARVSERYYFAKYYASPYGYDTWAYILYCFCDLICLQRS